MARLRLVKEGTVVTPQQQQLVDEAHHALPGLAHDATEELFPRKKGVGRCRLCGQQKQLMREYVPPRTAYNAETGRMHSLLDCLARTAEGVLPGGFVRQGGNWGYTLCADCDHFTGHEYSTEYGRMAGGIVNTFVGVNVNELDAQLEQPIARFGLTGAAAGLAPRPGAFVREVLALMCTMSADFDLAGKFPAIRRIVLDGALVTGASRGTAKRRSAGRVERNANTASGAQIVECDREDSSAVMRVAGTDTSFKRTN